MNKRKIVIPLLGILFGVLVAVLASPGLMEDLGLLPARSRCCPHPKNGCILNLKQIDGAKATWALENKKTDSDIPTATDLYGATAYIRDEAHCPEGGKYVIGSVRQKPRCSIVGHTL